MNDMSHDFDTQEPDLAARDWMKILSKYREPIKSRSIFEIAVTVIPFMLLWAASCWALQVSFWLSLPISIIAAGFLVRIFLIQHDCGHGAFFKTKAANDWVGRVFGVLTLTPYAVWRKNHAIHHGASGNLDQRGTGDLLTLTVAEYEARSTWGKLKYRAYRHPITLFIIGPVYIYLVENRLPLGHMKHTEYWISSMGTNVALAAIAGALIWLLGLSTFLLVFLPVTLIAASIGVWLFYVQHQFEDTHWESEPDWQVHEAALHGSSHYVLPQPLKWISANIGIHHVHHLYSKIPFYRLSEVIKDHPALGEMSKLTLRESFSCVKLQLWDENRRKLVSYAEARMAAKVAA